MKHSKYEIINLLILAIPLIFSNIANSAANLISMYFISHISTNALAAGAVITSTYGFIVMVVISILYAVSMMVGKMHGAGRHHEIGAIVFAGIVITLIIGTPLTVLLFYTDSILESLGQPHAISILAAEYFKGLSIGFIPSLAGTVYMQLFMGISRMKIIVWFTSLGVVINSALSYACIFGFYNLPAMGIYGAGFANSITTYILLSSIIVFIYFSSRFAKYQLFKLTSFNFKYLVILLKMGIPISIQFSAELLAFSVLTYLMGLIGIEALSAQQIALQCSMFSLMTIMAIAQSSTILVSQSLGQGDLSRWPRIANAALSLGTTTMLLIGIIYWFYPLKLISIYLDTANSALDRTINLTKTILFISAFTQLFDGGRNIAAGLLRGHGDTKSSMLTSIISCWLIGIPAAIIFGFLLDLGAQGIRLGMMLGIMMGCFNLIYRVYWTDKTTLHTFAYAK